MIYPHIHVPGYTLVLHGRDILLFFSKYFIILIGYRHLYGNEEIMFLYKKLIYRMYISTYIITIVRKLDEPRTKVFKLILSETRKEISSFDRLVPGTCTMSRLQYTMNIFMISVYANQGKGSINELEKSML